MGLLCLKKCFWQIKSKSFKYTSSMKPYLTNPTLNDSLLFHSLFQYILSILKKWPVMGKRNFHAVFI